MLLLPSSQPLVLIQRSFFRPHHHLYIDSSGTAGLTLTASFHYFKSHNFKLRVSTPKTCVLFLYFVIPYDKCYFENLPYESTQIVHQTTSADQDMFYDWSVMNKQQLSFHDPTTDNTVYHFGSSRVWCIFVSLDRGILVSLDLDRIGEGTARRLAGLRWDKQHGADNDKAGTGTGTVTTTLAPIPLILLFSHIGTQF